MPKLILLWKKLIDVVLATPIADTNNESQINNEYNDAEPLTNEYIGLEALGKGADLLSAKNVWLQTRLHGISRHCV